MYNTLVTEQCINIQSAKNFSHMASHKKNRYNVNIITKRYVFGFHSHILMQSSYNVFNCRHGITVKEISNVVTLSKEDEHFYTSN